MSYFEIIPEELLIEILTYLEYNELMRLYNNFPIIQTDKFWMFKLYTELPSFKLSEYLSNNPIIHHNIRGTYDKEQFKIIINYDPSRIDRRGIQRGVKCEMNTSMMLIDIMLNLGIQIPIIHQSLYEALYYFIIVKHLVFSLYYLHNLNTVLYNYNSLISKTKDQMCQLIQQHLIANNLIV